MKYDEDILVLKDCPYVFRPTTLISHPSTRKPSRLKDCAKELNVYTKAFGDLSCSIADIWKDAKMFARIESSSHVYKSSRRKVGITR